MAEGFFLFLTVPIILQKKYQRSLLYAVWVWQTWPKLQISADRNRSCNLKFQEKKEIPNLSTLSCTLSKDTEHPGLLTKCKLSSK